MKKKLSLILAIVLSFTLLIAACSPNQPAAPAGDGDNGQAATADDDATGDDEPAGAGETREILVYSTIVNEAAAPHFFAYFEEEHNVSIVHINITAEEFMRTLSVALGGGQEIDVLGVNGQDIRALSGRGVIRDMSDFAHWYRFSPSSIEQVSIGGTPFAVPADTAGGMNMYYNYDLFERYGVSVPTNMAELRVARDAFAEHGISMFAHCGATIYMWPSWYFMLFNSTSGGYAVERTEEILRGQGSFTDPDSLQAFQILAELGDGFFQPGVNAADREAGEQVFIQELTAMTFAGSWQLSSFRLAGMGDNLRATSQLSFVDGEPFRTTGAAGAGNAVTIATTTPDESLAMALVEYWTRDEKVVEMQYADYLESPRTSAAIFANVNAQIPEGIELDPIEEYWRINMLPGMKIWLDWLWPPEVTTAFQQQIQMVVGQQTTAEAAAAEVQRVLEELFADGYDFDDLGE